MSTPRIDFALLDLRDALDLAILIEEEAKDRYEELASQMELHRTPEAAAFFRQMIRNEAKHEEELASRRQILFGDSAPRVDRAMLFDVEAPDYDEARAFMSPRRAMEVALRAERKAHDFFDAALPRIKDPEVRALFEELRTEEVEHQQMVLAQMAKLPEGPEPDPSDFADEPAAQ